MSKTIEFLKAGRYSLTPAHGPIINVEEGDVGTYPSLFCDKMIAAEAAKEADPEEDGIDELEAESVQEIVAAIVEQSKSAPIAKDRMIAYSREAFPGLKLPAGWGVKKMAAAIVEASEKEE